MARTTKVDVRRVWAIYVDEAKGAGFDVEGWTLTLGSPSSGVNYEARTADGKPVPGAVGEGFSRAFLGFTATDAYNALRHMAGTLEAVRLLHNPE